MSTQQLIDQARKLADDLAIFHQGSTQGKWGKGKTTHETVALFPDGAYRIGEFRHADDASFVDYAHHHAPAIISSMRQLAAELERLERKPLWQPINSAPTDGTEFLAFSPNTGAVILTYLESDHPDYDGDTPHVTWDHTSFWNATHWMPLPAAPDIGEGEGK